MSKILSEETCRRLSRQKAMIPPSFDYWNLGYSSPTLVRPTCSLAYPKAIGVLIGSMPQILC